VRWVANDLGWAGLSLNPHPPNAGGCGTQCRHEINEVVAHGIPQTGRLPILRTAQPPALCINRDQGFSEFQILKVFCMFGSVNSAKQASRSMGPSTTHFMSERFTTSVAGI
jgi:hypothetical protein